MKNTVATIAIASTATLLSVSAFAQAPQSANEIAIASIESSVRSDTSAALAAIDAQDFQLATTLLRSAEASATRLSLQAITEKLASVTPSFQSDDTQFALAGSSTIVFEEFLKTRGTAERRFRDNEGRVVTVRVFGEEQDLKDFMFIADDTAMIEKGGLELAEMRGETAIKRRGEDDALSVLMMSEDDHALIEVESDDEDAVMAFIGELESASDE